MKRILLVKTSSLGDVIHNLPVATDLRQRYPEADIDWCVEEGFQDIPRLHPAIHRVIPVALRRWRNRLLSRSTWAEIGAFRAQLRAETYDAILDTQGLLKSALICRLAQGPRLGYDRNSIREPLATRFYDLGFPVDRGLHAVSRNRLLAAAALHSDPHAPLDYGLHPAPGTFAWLPEAPVVILLTAASRDRKRWADPHWTQLGRELAHRGFVCLLPGGSPAEQSRAAELAETIPAAFALPRQTLAELAALFARADLVVGVDTGLTHLAAALGRPTIGLYTATQPGLTGLLGTAFHRNLGGENCPPDPGPVLAACLEGLSR